MTIRALLCSLFLTSIGVLADLATAEPLELWYPQPASQWTEALPVGNGSMGAMIYGGVGQEVIQFNHDTIWTGHPEDYQNPGAAEYFPKIRQLLFEGKQQEAETMAMQHFMSSPLKQNSFQPFGDLVIDFAGHDAPVDYKRTLDLKTATSIVTYKIGQTVYTRQVFASYPDKVIVVRLSADKAGQLSFKAYMRSPHVQSEQFLVDQNTLGLRGGVSGTWENDNESKLTFEGHLMVRHEGGNVDVSDEGIEVAEADSVTFFLTGASSYVNYLDITGKPSEKCNAVIQKIEHTSFAKIKERHLADYQKLFGNLRFDLGITSDAQKPTDERILNFHKGTDPHLVTLLFQYGRYLLISSSRPGSQAANLQGVWNDSLKPAWASKYTTNINAEMNYWPAEIANLSECQEPFFDLIEDCSKSGAKTAKTYYGLDGWVLHHNTDIWRGTAPINHSNHGIWPTGGAWVCQHLWWHYEFSGDKDFLRKRAYPIMKSAAIFFSQYLVEDPRNEEHLLISGPSNSPENGGLVMGPTMDHQIIRNLFSNCIEASEILNVDKDFAGKLAEMSKRIAPNRIGQHGQLQEWLEDKDNPNSKHRHVSHLWGLHPGSEITRQDTPELYEAAKQSLIFRGDGATGWSMGWKVNFWARLHDGNHAMIIMNNLLRLTGSPKTDYRGGGVYANLFDAHPPFQIDGNFGVTSGIIEMLVQSHCRTEQGNYIIELLPALPDDWKSGHIEGVRARGGVEVNVAWEDGILVKADLTGVCDAKCILCYDGKDMPINLKKGQTKNINNADFTGK